MTRSAVLGACFNFRHEIRVPIYSEIPPPPHLVCACLYELRSRDIENRFESIRVAIFGFDTIADYFDFFWRWRRQIGEKKCRGLRLLDSILLSTTFQRSKSLSDRF